MPERDGVCIPSQRFEFGIALNIMPEFKHSGRGEHSAPLWNGEHSLSPLPEILSMPGLSLFNHHLGFYVMCARAGVQTPGLNVSQTWGLDSDRL
jgi:hypothetical protein